jgi:tetratricopeptide (TPR) repeat protein
MKTFVTILIFLNAFQLIAQPNCEAYKHTGDDLKYKACKVAEKRAGHYQFSREYQEALDQALAIDSTFAFAYRAKSTAYLKSGDFITWKALMDKAVQYAPEEQLGYRGWCRFQFFRDYEGAIQDLELLDRLIDYDLGFSVNGDYHLHIARGLCYKAIGQPLKAMEIIQQQLADSTYYAGAYDYLHLGVLQLETGNHQQAIESFQAQEAINDLAENRFYLALTYQQLGEMDMCQQQLKIAKEKYEEEIKMFDPYTAHLDKIYLKDIELALQNIDKNN